MEYLDQKKAKQLAEKARNRDEERIKAGTHKWVYGKNNNHHTRLLVKVGS